MSLQRRQQAALDEQSSSSDEYHESSADESYSKPNSIPTQNTSAKRSTSVLSTHESSMILALKKSATTDTQRSKEMFKNLTLRHGSEKQTQHQERWSNIWDSWAALQDGDKSSKPPDSEMYICFMDTILHYTSAHGKGKYAPSKKTMIQTIWYINNHLKFKYPQWQYEGHIEICVKSWLNMCVDQGQLIQGTWRQKQFVTFHVLRKLMNAWFHDAFQNGTCSFDVTLMKTLPIAMMVAVDCRAGDCIPSNPECTRKGFFMKFEDIRISLEGEEKLVSNLVANVVLRYEKFEKYVIYNDLTSTTLSILLKLINLIHAENQTRIEHAEWSV